MRISINSKRITGPYGGVNAFANNFEAYLKGKGHEVYRKLVPGLDAIVITIVQSVSQTSAYDLDTIRDYIKLNPNTVVVLRVNTCDEQRGTDLGANRAMLKATGLSDHVVFVSAFLQGHYRDRGLDPSIPQSVVLSGGNPGIFNSQGGAEWHNGEKLRLITHHWSSNFMKGFDIYERLDQLLGHKPYQDLFEFTIVGNPPLGVDFKNTTVMKPMDKTGLALILKKHHVYISAARHEPAGMHYIEGMMIGLPVLYLNSGSLPEYCGPYGIEYDLVDFEEKLLLMKKKYPELRQKVLSCPYTADAMVKGYGDLVEDLVKKRRASPRPATGLIQKIGVYFIARPGRTIEKVSGLVKKVVRHLK